eukprot:gene12133-8354_t
MGFLNDRDESLEQKTNKQRERSYLSFAMSRNRPHLYFRRRHTKN